MQNAINIYKQLLSHGIINSLSSFRSVLINCCATPGMRNINLKMFVQPIAKIFFNFLVSFPRSSVQMVRLILIWESGQFGSGWSFSLPKERTAAKKSELACV